MGFRSDSCSDPAPPYPLPYITTALSIFFCLVTVPGNILVLTAIIRDPYKNLRTPFNFLVLNLALSDLAVGFIVDPLSIIYHLFEGLGRNLPGFGIEVEHMAYLIACTASVLSMAAMTVDRYIAVVYPTKYRVYQTKTKIFTVCIIIWVIASSVSCLYFIIGDFLYRFVFGNVVVIFTFCILAFSFFRIHLTLRHQRSRLNVQQTNPQNQTQARGVKHELRVTKMFSIILLWYVICYLPACIAIYLVNLCHICSCDVIHWMRDSQLCFLLLSSAVNPYVYAWTSPRFRSAFLNILSLTRLDNRFAESASTEHQMSVRSGDR